MGLASAFNGSRNLVILLRLGDGRYVDANDRFLEACGFAPGEFLGRTTAELPLLVKPQWPELIEQARHFHSVGEEPLTFLGRDGREQRGLLRAELLEHEGEPHLLVFIGDIRGFDARIGAWRRARLRYRRLFERAAEALYEIAPNGRLLGVNPACAHLAGYATPAELIREREELARLYADPTAWNELYGRLCEAESVEGREVEILRRDGSRVVVLENVWPVQDEHAALVGYEGTWLDLSGRRAAENALRVSEEKYRTLVEHSQDGVFITHDNKYIYVNQAYADMLGYRPEEMSGESYWKFIAPEDHPLLERIWQQRYAGAWEKQAYEIRLLKKDGGRILASVRSGPIMLDGKLSSIGTVRDITEERRKEQALLAAERNFRTIFENAVLGMYQSTPDGRFLRANRALARMLGYESAEDLMRGLRHIGDLYRDPAERRQFNAELERAGQVSDREIALRRRDGTLIWVSVSARAVRDESGAVACYEGSILDITARKAAEDARRRSELQYRILVENSQVGVFINENGNYSYVNHAFAAMLGYSEAEMTGMSYRRLFPPEELPAADERFRRRQRGEAVPNNYEAALLHKDGKTRVLVTLSIGVIELDGRRLMIGTARDITEQRRSEARLRYHASHDPLTGLPNRTLFLERLSQAMSRSREPQGPSYAVLFVDLDSFKIVNDSLGHAAGDALLVQVARRLERCLGPEDMVARHGGDEFTLLVIEPAGSGRAVVVAKQVLAELVQPFQVEGHEIYTNASIGIAPGAPGYANTHALLRDADTAMYQAKAAGRAGYVVFDQSMHARVRERLQIEAELREGFQHDEFRVEYQPIVALADRRVLGFEALLRWQHPKRGRMAPEDFLAVAEETGLLLPIGWWLLRVACRQAREWREQTGGEVAVAVNLSHRQFGYPALPQRIEEILRETGLAPGTLHLEITETVFLENPKLAKQRLRTLKELGVALYLDDFGTGYSSLNYLSALPIDSLKVDRSFVEDILSNRRHAAVVRTIVELGRDLGMQVIAEGVENAEQLTMLSALGCQAAQGYFFGRPANAELARQFLAGIPSRSRPVFAAPRPASDK